MNRELCQWIAPLRSSQLSIPPLAGDQTFSTHIQTIALPQWGERQATIIVEVCWLKVLGGGDRASQARDSSCPRPLLTLPVPQKTMDLFSLLRSSCSIFSFWQLYVCPWVLYAGSCRYGWVTLGLSKEQERARILPELSVISVCSAMCGGRDAFSQVMCSEGARIFLNHTRIAYATLVKGLSKSLSTHFPHVHSMLTEERNYIILLCKQWLRAFFVESTFGIIKISKT